MAPVPVQEAKDPVDRVETSFLLADRDLKELQLL